MVRVLAVSGKKRSGKDELFKTISDAHLTIPNYFEPCLVQRLSFGDAVKEEVARHILEPVFGISYEESLQEHMRDRLRALWQVWGTEARQGLSGKMYWAEQLGLRLEAIQALSPKDQDVLVVITDLRFRHEFEFLRKFNPCFVRVVRNIEQATDNHPSEVDLDDMPPDAWDEIILNNGSLVQYQNKVLDLYRRRFCFPKFV